MSSNPQHTSMTHCTNFFEAWLELS